jgi:chromosomal replication initiation ATPase DnaA
MAKSPKVIPTAMGPQTQQMLNAVSNEQLELKYKDLISKSQSQLEQEELDLKVQIAQSDLQVTVATTKKDLASAKRRLIAAQSAVPYDVQDEFDTYQQVQGLESALAFAERILLQRF